MNASYASDRVLPHTAAGRYSTTEDLLRWQNGLYGRQGDLEGLAAEDDHAFQGDYGLGSTSGQSMAVAPPCANLTCFLDRGISVVVLGNLSVAPAPEIAAYLGALAHGDTVQLLSERKSIA